MPIHPENRDRYPADWKAIVARIRKRSGNRCECTGQCGAQHVGLGADRDTFGNPPVVARCPWGNAVHNDRGSLIVLTVAHLDHTPEHCDDANLLHMCQGCHLRYDVDDHRESKARRQREALEKAGQERLDL